MDLLQLEIKAKLAKLAEAKVEALIPKSEYNQIDGIIVNYYSHYDEPTFSIEKNGKRCLFEIRGGKAIRINNKKGSMTGVEFYLLMTEMQSR